MSSELSCGNPCLFLREIQYCITEVCTVNDSRAQITACQHCSHQKRICQISLIENLHAWKNKSFDFPSYFQMMLFVAMAWWCGVQSNFLHKMSSLICTIQRASKVLATEKIYNKQEKLICICRFTHSLSPCETLDNCSNLFCDCLAQSNSTSQKMGAIQLTMRSMRVSLRSAPALHPI